MISMCAWHIATKTALCYGQINWALHVKMEIKFHIDEHGIEIKRNYISSSTIDAIKYEVNATNEEYPKHGIRGADKKFSSINQLAQSNEFIELASSILGSKPHIVRVIFFDKTPDKNWLVTWHQDKTIALNKKEDITGWGPWSIKDNTHHVQPSLEVLNKMVTFRLHLDDANENNGCLKVILKSHELGILTQEQLTEVINTHEPYLCKAKEGDLVIMKPHILHSSSKSLNPGHRRVVHVEYSNYQLPAELKWA